MKVYIKHKLRIILTTALLILFTLPVLAQSGGGYDLSWSTADGGGGASSGGTFVLTGTSGQADAGVMSGGVYPLSGGFWKGGEAAPPPPDYELFLPLIVK